MTPMTLLPVLTETRKRCRISELIIQRWFAIFISVRELVVQASLFLLWGTGVSCAKSSYNPSPSEVPSLLSRVLLHCKRQRISESGSALMHVKAI
uniref:Secreted protein n=1 Tax=Mesocestoides corti TaxID=53468 RepID=A0A5K3FZ72_MESCO